MMHELRLAVRILQRHSGFTFVAVLTLALGIGANTAVFSVMDAVLLRPLPYPEPERVVGLTNVPLRFTRTGIVGHIRVVQQSAAFAGIGIYANGGLNLGGGTSVCGRRGRQRTAHRNRERFMCRRHSGSSRQL